MTQPTWTDDEHKLANKIGDTFARLYGECTTDFALIIARAAIADGWSWQSAPTTKLPQCIADFEQFLNEPPQYEDRKFVRDYRHEAYAKWRPILDYIKSQRQSAAQARNVALGDAIKLIERHADPGRVIAELRALKSHDGGSPGPSRDWCIEAAKREGDLEVGVGPPRGDPKGASPSGRSQPSPALDQAWYKINALGGTCGEYDDFGKGINNAVEQALFIIEDLGGRDPLALQSPATEAPVQRCCVDCNAILANGPQPVPTYERHTDLTAKRLGEAEVRIETDDKLIALLDGRVAELTAIAAQMAEALRRALPIVSTQADIESGLDHERDEICAATTAPAMREALAAYGAQQKKGRNEDGS